MNIKIITPPIEDLMSRSRRPAAGILRLLVLIWFAFSLASQAAPPPKPTPTPTPPDGDLGNGNTAEGTGALFSLTTGADNTAMGFDALFSTTQTNHNTAVGFESLYSNTQGFQNTGAGSFALYSNTSGYNNTATGIFALFSNATGSDNSAYGYNALGSNVDGSYNTAVGESALNGAGTSYSTAVGFSAGASGFASTAIGAFALVQDYGGYNTGSGYGALSANSTGYQNTATGSSALNSNSTGNNNTATGFNALYANSTGNNNIALGYSAGSVTTGDNNIDIGNAGAYNESSTIRIGGDTGYGSQTAIFIAGINGAAVTGSAVLVSSSGQLGVRSSSARFKQNIQTMDKASDALLALRPVTFRYKPEIDPDGIPQFGLVAEEVEKVNPDLVVRDAHGEPYTVRYEAVDAMLLNEFLKEHRKTEAQTRKLQEQEAAIAQLRQDFQFKLTEQQKQIEALTTGLQKVSAELELGKPAPQMVLKNQ